MTKKQEGMLWMYRRSSSSTIFDAYEKPSRAKCEAYNSILKECSALNGHDVRIPSHSCHFFTMAYQYEKEGKQFLVYHTAQNRFEFEI